MKWPNPHEHTQAHTHLSSVKGAINTCKAVNLCYKIQKQPLTNGPVQILSAERATRTRLVLGQRDRYFERGAVSMEGPTPPSATAAPSGTVCPRKGD